MKLTENLLKEPNKDLALTKAIAAITIMKEALEGLSKFEIYGRTEGGVFWPSLGAHKYETLSEWILNPAKRALEEVEKL